mmetsp:Transcript_67972/g.175194  ORF Transcript_67972/g.175194 Transcript_67972/m.175194 type:complete len:218 (+) Transcript_67972:551-1204(+)
MTSRGRSFTCFSTASMDWRCASIIRSTAMTRNGKKNQIQSRAGACTSSSTYTHFQLRCTRQKRLKPPSRLAQLLVPRRMHDFAVTNIANMISMIATPVRGARRTLVLNSCSHHGMPLTCSCAVSAHRCSGSSCISGEVRIRCMWTKCAAMCPTDPSAMNHATALWNEIGSSIGTHSRVTPMRRAAVCSVLSVGSTTIEKFRSSVKPKPFAKGYAMLL